jgi:Chaperone of endosialidase
MKTAMRFFTIFLLLALHCDLNAQNMGIKMPISTLPNTTLDVNGASSFREGTARTLVNGANNDIVIDSMSFYRLTGPTLPFSITGFTNGQNGRMLSVVNATTQVMTIVGATGPTVNNQILTGGATFTVPANGSANFQYNTTLNKWVLTGTSGSAGWNLLGNGGTNPSTNFIGTTDVQDLVFRTQNTEGVRLTAANQNMGIGVLSPIATARLQVANTGTNHAFYAPTATNYNYFSGKTAFGKYTTNPTATPIIGAASETYVHVQDSVTSIGASIMGGLGVKLKVVPTANTTGALYGINSRVHTAAYNSQNITILQASNFDFRHYGTGTISNAYGAIARCVNLGTGRIDKAWGINVDCGNYGGTIDTMIGIQIAGGRFGTLTNANAGFGLLLGDVVATSAYGVYQTSFDDDNYFAGYTGFGTSSPTARLHISSNSGGSDNDVLLSGYNATDIPVYNIRRARGTEASPLNIASGDGLGGMHMYGYVNGGWNYLSSIAAAYKGDGTTNLSNLVFQTSNSVRMTIDETGNVGINTTTPTAGFKLSVNGSAEKSGGGSWATYSDSRVKRNIRQFTEGLATLEKINPVWFQYNNKSGYEDTTKTYVGVIAQEVEKVAPYMVEKTKTASFDDQRVYDSNALNYIG